MKSFSNDLPSADKQVSKEDFKAFKAELNSTLRVRMYTVLGLAAFNLIVTIVLIFATHH